MDALADLKRWVEEETQKRAKLASLARTTLPHLEQLAQAMTQTKQPGWTLAQDFSAICRALADI